MGRASRRLIGLTPYHPPAEAVWTLGVSQLRAWPEPFAGTKHLNRLLSVVAAGEALAQQVPEVLIRGGGMVGPWPWVGGGRSTVFQVMPGRAGICIPGTRRHGIEGASLGWLTDWALQAGLRVWRPARLPRPAADDEFGLINSLLGPRSIGCIKDPQLRRAWADGSCPALPGPLTARMQADFSREAGTPPLA